VFETYKVVGNVAGDVEFYSSLFVVLLESYAVEEVNIPVCYYFVVFLKVGDEVV